MLYKGVLMQKVGDTYSFIHKTVLEYFSVLHGIYEVNIIAKNGKINKDSIFNENLIEDKGVQEFYFEMISNN